MAKCAFITDKKGGIAAGFAMALVPIIGIVGAAIDYSRLSAIRAQTQESSDRAALAAAIAENSGSEQKILDTARSLLMQDAPGLNVTSVTGSWIDESSYRVEIEANLELPIIGIVPGLPKNSKVAAVSVARRNPLKYRVVPPKITLLDDNAEDYNRVVMHCYDAARKDEPSKGRRDFVPVADNASPPTDFASAPGYRLPDCAPGEVVSYMVRNVRRVRTNSSQWNRNNDYYEYFTDIEYDQKSAVMKQNMKGDHIERNGRRVAIDLTNKPMLETVLCNTEAECRSTTEGGILPPLGQENRTPAVATQPCTPGKQMYMGFEDRPGYDRDYDDIRLIVSCPEVIRSDGMPVRLTQ